jgi:pyridoxine kinase
MIVILSSQVAASRVGGGAQAAILARMGFETALAPTVLFGRHPGLGAPGGGAVPQALFESVLSGIEASGALASAEAVIAGYFHSSEQVAAAAAFIDTARASNPSAWIVVDPIMGDAGTGLYVSESVAGAIAGDLLPRADLITPNAWELAQLSGRAVRDARQAIAAAHTLCRPVLASSIAVGEDVGVLYAAHEGAWLASHPRSAGDLKGAGDLLTAFFAGHTLAGASPPEALRAAVGEIAALVVEGPACVAVTRL